MIIVNDFESYCYKNYIYPNDIIYDIGAYIGLHSIEFINLGAKFVYAFEPSPFNINQLQDNIKNYTNIQLCPVGLNDKTEACFTRFKDCRTDIPQDSEQHILYTTLNEYMIANSLPDPNFIKMDIEGMESIVLKTFKFLFLGCRPRIFVEIHAAPRDEKQNYPKNPHWIYPEDGGFNFNDLYEYNYLCIEKDHMNPYTHEDFNPPPRSHKAFMLIPKENYNESIL